MRTDMASLRADRPFPLRQTRGATDDPTRYYPSASMRRFVLPGIAVAVVAALLALLAFGVANQGTSSSIDASVARGDFPVAPSLHAALPVLGSRA